MFIGTIGAILIVVTVLIARSGWRPHLPSLPGSTNPSPWVSIPWRIVTAGIIIIHATLIISWLEGYAVLASLKIFWLGHVILVFLALTSTQTSKGVIWVRKVVILVLAIGIIAESGQKIWGWEATRRAKLLSGVHSFAHIAQDAKLQILADAETGDGSPGSGKHTDKFGKVIVNDKNRDGSKDYGKWQINSSHLPEAKRLGIDIMSEEGNRRMAIVLMEKNPDLRDWNSSRHRWGPKLLALAQGAPQQLVTKPAEVSQEIPPSPRRVTVAKISSRRGRHADVASAKYCWTTTRGPRHRYSDSIKIYNSVSPAETELVSLEGKRGKKLVCVW